MEAEAHLKRVAKVLDTLDADIVHLIEVENCAVLSELLSRMIDGASYKGYMVPSKDTATGQNCGLITRIDPSRELDRTEARVNIPIEGSSCRKKSKSASVSSIGLSKHYFTEFTVPLSPAASNTTVLRLIFGGAHLLANPMDRGRCGAREGQALVLRQHIEQRYFASMNAASENHSVVGVVVTGDMNDVDAIVPGLDGQRPITRVLDILRSGALIKENGQGVTRPVTDSQLLLENLASLVPLPRRYTDWHDVNKNCQEDGPQEHSLIDHILVNDVLRRRLVKFEILNDHIKLYFYEGLPWAFKEKLEKVSFNVFILESGMQIEFKSW